MNPKLGILWDIQFGESFGWLGLKPDDGGTKHCSFSIMCEFGFFVRVLTDGVEVLFLEKFGDFVRGGGAGGRGGRRARYGRYA
jgi:hypothetical protein